MIVPHVRDLVCIPFREFEVADFATFNRVKTKDPLIAEPEWGVVIIDDRRVDLVLRGDDGTSFSREFVMRTIALLVASHLIALDKPTHEQIEEFLDRI